MPLNLITDAWIPVFRHGQSVNIRPHEIAASGIERLNWPRDDLNIACMELLIGLTFLADPPLNDGDWHDRYKNPDPDRLRCALKPFSPYFEMSGEGPRFLQDKEPFEKKVKDYSPPDLLFIDSPGMNAAKKNSDLMVRRWRYPKLDLPFAAIALYTLQAFAPSGGAGNRTSMRGGGPMVTLVKPLDGGDNPIWRFVWCNVPEGNPSSPLVAEKTLPWLQPTRISDKNQVVTPDLSNPVEAFFGMPRRIRLVFNGDTVIGVVQRPHGANYKFWQHPLTPYYCQKVGGELLPIHPKPGILSYENWLGLVFGNDSEKKFKASTVSRFHQLTDVPEAEICVGGWAMNKMTPQDFNLHIYPTFNLDFDMDTRVRQLVEAANSVVGELSKHLKQTLSISGLTANAVNETFFALTEQDFANAVRLIANKQELNVERNWVNRLRQIAVQIFDQHTLSSLTDRNILDIEKIINARRRLISFFGSKSMHKLFPDLQTTG